MTQAINNPAAVDEQRRREWVERVDQVIQQAEDLAVAKDWATARNERTLNERGLGQYTVPLLRIRLPLGEVHVIPIARNVIGADGRIDIEAFPTTDRVKLIWRGRDWEIYSDTNVRLPAWNAETFARIAQDLLAGR
jgi:hypothetical protein